MLIVYVLIFAPIIITCALCCFRALSVFWVFCGCVRCLGCFIVNYRLIDAAVWFAVWFVLFGLVCLTCLL